MRMPALACTLLLAACAADGGGSTATTSDSAGVAIVSNVYKDPAWGREERWLLAANPSIQVGNIPGNAVHQFFHVAHSRRLADGGIAVANSGFGDVRRFDKLGFYVVTLSLGPDAAEKAAPLRVYESAPGDLLVYQADHSISQFHGTDVRPTKHALAEPGEAFDSVEVIGAFRDGSLALWERRPRDEAKTGVGRRSARLLHYAPDGRLLGAIGDFDDDAVLFADHGAYLFGPTSAAAAGDSTIWYGDGERYELREVARDGRTLRVVRLDRPRAPVLEADRTAYRSAASRAVLGTTREATMPATLDSSVFADTFPSFDRIVVDDLGDVWARNYQWFDLGSGRSWSVFDPQGRFLGEVITPSILEIHQIGADFILGRMADLSGREAIYIFKLQKPGAAGSGTAEPAPADSGAAPY